MTHSGPDPAFAASQSSPCGSRPSGLQSGVEPWLRRLLKRDEDGWLLHDGGDCPVQHDVMIDRVMYRTGDIATAEMRAHCLSWQNDRWFPMLDIVAFTLWDEPALAAGARSAETAQQAQSEGRQSGGEAATPSDRQGSSGE